MVILRDALAGDRITLAGLHQEAFAGHLGALAGQRYLQKMIGWFLANQKGLVLVAEDEVQCMVGYVFGAPAGYRVALNQALRREYLWATLSHPCMWFHPKFRDLISALLRPSGEKREPVITPRALLLYARTFSLVGIGVSPPVQGQGVGSRLLTAFEERVQAKNYRRLRLSVYADNLAARYLYEKQGWYVSEELSRVSGAIYYQKDLETPAPS